MNGTKGHDLAPLYMWAGGKRKLVKHYAPIWPQATKESYTTYVEPFFGGGAVFCWLSNENNLPPTTLVNDVNRELIGVLNTVRTDPKRFIAATTALVTPYLDLVSKEERKQWYYALRKRYWAAPTPENLYILMRLGFNGIWQTCKDSNGLFGTPAGLLNHKRVEQVLNPTTITNWAAALKTATLTAGTYETLQLPDTPALLYLDPPYRDSYTTYGTGFSDADQQQLSRWYRTQHALGHKVLLANRVKDDDGFFEDLLGDIATFHYFDVTYTAGRRKRTETGFEAKPAREFLAISKDL